MGKRLREFFQRFAKETSDRAGSPWTFLLAFGTVLVWGVSGPLFHFSDTWQLVINTGTTIVTFLMVFLIQNTQNRDSKAIQLKLDELILAKRGARNYLIDLEGCTDDELEALHQEFQRLRELHKHDTVPAVPAVTEAPSETHAGTQDTGAKRA